MHKTDSAKNRLAPLPRHLRPIARPQGRKPYRMRCCLCIDGQEWLQLWFDGQLQQGRIDGVGLPLLAACAPDSVRPQLIYDAACHGYEALFCAVPPAPPRRLQRYGDDVYRIHVQLEYRTDLSAERDYLVFDDEGRVELADGSWLAWPDAQADAFDTLSVLLEDHKGHVWPVFASEAA